MAKFEDITIDVKAKLVIDRRTAETCLRMVEIFCNENGINLIGHRSENGEITFEFECGNVPNISPDAFAAISAIGAKTHREV